MEPNRTPSNVLSKIKKPKLKRSSPVDEKTKIFSVFIQKTEITPNKLQKETLN
jgi:hypothetical protein